MDQYEYDFDLCPFWDDLEYQDDTYWDSTGRRPAKIAEKEQAGQKRKRAAPAKEAVTDKRRKVSRTQHSSALHLAGEGVIGYVARAERVRKPAPMLKAAKSYALLPDWRERYANVDGLNRKVAAMPTDMQKAAEAKEEETPVKTGHIQFEDEGEGDWEDEEDGEEGGLGLDPEVLKQVLKAKLAESGLDGVDEEAFMSSIENLLAGEEGGDDGVGELAEMLLRKATQNGGDGALSGWLTQQGVSLEGGEDDTESVATTEVPEPSASQPRRAAGAQSSPRDSAIGGVRKLAVRGGSPDQKQKTQAAMSSDAGENCTEKELLSPPKSEDAPKTSDGSTRAKAAKAADAGGPEAQLRHELQKKAEDVKITENANGTDKASRKRKAEEEPPASMTESGGKRAVKEPTTRRTRSAKASRR